jgi:heat shock protein HslJ
MAGIVVTATVMACGDDDGSAAGTGVVGRTFLSESVAEDAAPRPLVDGTRIRLDFSDDGRITASAGCNTLGGDVEIEREQIVVGELSTTEMGCDPPRHAQDEWLADVLSANPAYALDGDRLRLTSNGTTIELTDRRVADPDRPLKGTRWQLDGIIDGDAVSSVPAPVSATVRFDAGRVAVDVAGCNEGGGDVAITATEVRVGSLVMTTRGCERPAAEVEAAIVAVLDGTIGYEIEAASLTLTNPNGRGLTLRA